MQKGELFDNRYGEILAAIEANPGISNAELAESYRLSYNIIRALTVAMEKEATLPAGWKGQDSTARHCGM
jgi:ribosomal protein S6